MYAKTYKTKAKAMAAGKKALRTMNTVSGTRGGRIKSSQAIIGIVKTINGYVPIAKRR